MRKTNTFVFMSNLSSSQLFYWADTFETCSILYSNNHSDKNSTYDLLIAVGKKSELKINHGFAFHELSTYYSNNYLFGYFGYDLKNEVENLSSNNPSKINFPDLYFFEPEHIVLVKNGELNIISDNKIEILNQINAIKIPSNEVVDQGIKFNKSISKKQYIQKINAIKQDIIEGTIYELNFCHAFFADNCSINPLSFYLKLIELSPTPFSSYLKMGDKYIIGASPERFLQKKGNKILSQPIKGTIRRGETQKEDEFLKNQLQNSEKERAENVMIVDLVRNDLTRSANTGTIKVEELFGIYSFKHWHQMISTISAEISKDVSLFDCIKNAFPMGSMTGAPKIKAMELIEHYEETKRGVYSGAIGYITPEQDFDFNVVIRTLLYDAKTKIASFEVGSAITYDSDPEYEYNECLLKAKAILTALNAEIKDEGVRMKE